MRHPVFRQNGGEDGNLSKGGGVQFTLLDQFYMAAVSSVVVCRSIRKGDDDLSRSEDQQEEDVDQVQYVEYSTQVQYFPEYSTQVQVQ